MTVVSRHAGRAPGAAAVRFFSGAGERRTEEVLTYGALDRSARATAVALRERCVPGDRVLLPFPPGPGFAEAFLGCQYAGLVPVPVPVPARTSHQVDRTVSVAADARPALVLTAAAALPDVRARLDGQGLARLGAVAIETAREADPDGWDAPPRVPDDLAFLQYTSGSTSDPKGVMVSHANLVHNLDLMRRSHGWDRDTRFCSWLPLHHDMGLIAMLLMPLYLGGTAAIMPATDFLKRPRTWLQLMDETGAQVSCAPDFAYDLCARRVTAEQAAELDLSRWRQACNGAEPVRAETLRRFGERFAIAGFAPEAFLPGYGLAEATLYVSGAPAASAPVVTRVDAEALRRDAFVPADGGSASLVSSGHVRDLDVRIVDPATARTLPDGRVGEVWIRGGSVAQGYWMRPEETARAFGAVTSGGEGGFLRTGDLGVRQGTELYITGRLKEMLIVHGRNLYPHDIEREAEGLDEAFAGLASCAFAVPAPREEIVVVQEVRVRGLDAAEPSALARRARTALSTRLGVAVGGFVLVRVGQVSRTTSGKIQRLRVRERFAEGALRTVHEDLDAAVRDRYRPAVRRAAEPVRNPA
ncbi:fatty acyl-AMP ligase [Actinomadura sp. KC06]|uniref:fatty acyl-AMP ligase n=1 Tax=Actinomadura sp. KC06 TaxID=2530369 RepID=UPI00104E0D1F|nr:fatty acyl-AMP ligase [Actinomadura sp. KC06]TDD40129.1 fatty acyl-AMP ligase [Actinomadura sp. KC06]